MIWHNQIETVKLRQQIAQGKIRFGGNFKLKIYGSLACKSGKRMKIQNRVFFKNEVEALNLGFRPCGHCMKTQFQKWKHEKYELIQISKTS